MDTDAGEAGRCISSPSPSSSLPQCPPSSAGPPISHSPGHISCTSCSGLSRFCLRFYPSSCPREDGQPAACPMRSDAAMAPLAHGFRGLPAAIPPCSVKLQRAEDRKCETSVPGHCDMAQHDTFNLTMGHQLAGRFHDTVYV